MKAWLIKSFSKTQKRLPAGGAQSVPMREDAERTVPAATGQTVLASPSERAGRLLKQEMEMVAILEGL